VTISVPRADPAGDRATTVAGGDRACRLHVPGLVPEPYFGRIGLDLRWRKQQQRRRIGPAGSAMRR